MKYHRIRDLREDTDKTQDNVAKALEMHKTTYVRYESGDREPPLEIAIKIADFYNVSLDYITERTNDKRGLTRSEMSEQETELIKKFRSLSENGKGKILERMEIIAEQEQEEQANLKGVV